MLTSIKNKIEENIESFIHKLKKDYKLHILNPTLYKCLKEFSLRKGKRITFKICKDSYWYSQNS